MRLIRTVRFIEPELMDEPDLDVREHRHALAALGRVHAVSRTLAAVWPVIRDAAPAATGRPLRVLDVACGGGQVTISLARRAVLEGIPLEVTGTDISPVALDHARALAGRARTRGVRFERADALRDPMPEGMDVVLCTLFLHHLPDDGAAALLGRMRDAARRTLVVSDLRRTRLGHLYAWAGCRLLTTSRVCHVDGVRSVAAAFTTDEARAMAGRAGLAGAQVRETWPQRWLLVWRRPQGGAPAGAGAPPA